MLGGAAVSFFAGLGFGCVLAAAPGSVVLTLCGLDCAVLVVGGADDDAGCVLSV